MVRLPSRFVAMGVLFLFVVASAEAGQVISLQDAVRLTLERSNYLKAAESDVRAFEQDIKAAKSFHLPHVWLEERFIRTDIPSYVFSSRIDQGRMTSADMDKAPASFNEPNPLSDFRTSLSIEQPLFTPRTGIRVDMARKEVEVSRLRLQRNREEAVFNTLNAYVEVQKTRAMLASVESGVKDAEEHLRVARVREDAGTGIRADVLRATVALSEVEARRIRVHNDLKIAQARLALAVGEEHDTELDADDAEMVMSTPADLQEVTRKALESRNDLKELGKRLENARNLGRLAKADYLPTLSLSGSYQLDDRDTPFGSDGQHWMVGATLKWEAFDGFRRRAEEARAHEVRVGLSEQLEAYRKEVSFRIKEAWLRMADAGQRVRIASKALAEAEEGSRLVTSRFRNSLTTMSEVLEAQAALDQARANHVQADREKSLSQARLLHNAGLLMAELKMSLPDNAGPPDAGSPDAQPGVAGEK